MIYLGELVQVCKGGATFIISSVLVLLGGHDHLIQLLFYLIVVDFVFGLVKSIKLKKYSSTMARWGIVNKALELIIVAIFDQIDKTFGMEVFRKAAII